LCFLRYIPVAAVVAGAYDLKSKKVASPKIELVAIVIDCRKLMSFLTGAAFLLPKISAEKVS
jgi:hypothetical protein